MPATPIPVGKPTPSRRWLTPDEAAAHLGVTRRTIRNLIARGALAGYKLGTRSVRIDAHELDNVLRRIPTAGGPDA